MREFLKTRGFKMTPQRELIFRSFFEMDKHCSVEELYEIVKGKDRSIGYSTVWRNLKLICQVGLAQEVNIGDGITRFDRLSKVPHGHLFCLHCKELIEFNADQIIGLLSQTAKDYNFANKSFNVEVLGYCEKCQSLEKDGAISFEDENNIVKDNVNNEN
ncbi:MAG: transcriptional repressor [candidate division Zixibacteria bacterium]|nr:transcriptional repressor [candidate division Zixibacteria bacterium]